MSFRSAFRSTVSKLVEPVASVSFEFYRAGSPVILPEDYRGWLFHRGYLSSLAALFPDGVGIGSLIPDRHRHVTADPVRIGEFHLTWDISLAYKAALARGNQIDEHMELVESVVLAMERYLTWLHESVDGSHIRSVVIESIEEDSAPNEDDSSG